MTRYVPPVYPQWARKQHIEGVVRLQGTIGKDGRVRNLTFLEGPKALLPYAESAVRQWRYDAPMLNGQRLEVITTLDVSFTLRQ